MNPTRRVFMMAVAATAAGVATLANAKTAVVVAAAGSPATPTATPTATSPAAPAASAADLVDEKSPVAKGLGYVADTAKADQAKYPKHDKTQNCGACALYLGKAKSETGACPLFAGKQVSAKAWCSAFAKKAA